MKINKHKGTSLTGSVSMTTANAVTPFVVTSHIPETKENQSEQLNVVTKHSECDNRFSNTNTPFRGFQWPIKQKEKRILLKRIK